MSLRMGRDSSRDSNAGRAYLCSSRRTWLSLGSVDHYAEALWVPPGRGCLQPRVRRHVSDDLAGSRGKNRGLLLPLRPVDGISQLLDALSQQDEEVGCVAEHLWHHFSTARTGTLLLQ
jgi:hypothetical protein